MSIIAHSKRSKTPIFISHIIQKNIHHLAHRTEKHSTSQGKYIEINQTKYITTRMKLKLFSKKSHQNPKTLEKQIQFRPFPCQPSWEEEFDEY